MGPFDYSLNVATPFASALRGYQAGSAIRQDQFNQQAQEAELQQQQAKLQAQQQRQALLAGLASNPNATADDYTRVMTQMPDLAENLSKVWSLKNDAQQQSHSANLLQIGAALKSGSVDVAEKLLLDRAAAVEASGDKREADALRANAGVVRQNPALALGMIQAQLAASPRGKDAAEALAKFGAEQRAAELHPAAVVEGQAKAQSAVVGAKFAESKAVLDLKMGEEQIKKWAADTEIARRNSQIAAQHAAIAREGNALKRQEMQINLQEKIDKRDTALREKVGAAQSGAASIDNMLNTIQRVQQNQSLDRVIGVVDGRMPGVTSEQADAIALIETLGSQAFMAQIPNLKGMGALSNAEGEKLQASLQNLTRVQSPAQFRASLNEATRIMTKARENLARTTGVDLGKPDTPAAPGARPPLSSFQR